MRTPKNVVTAEEICQAVLHMIVEKFDGRPLDIRKTSEGLAKAAYHLNLTAIQAINEASAQTRKGKK